MMLPSQLSAHNKAKRTRYSAIKIALLYIGISLMWIALSDQALFSLEGKLPHNLFLFLTSAKSFLFTLVTGLVIFNLVRADQKNLIDSENQYRNIYEGNPNPMWIYDLATLQFVSVNDAAITNYGYSEEEFLSKSILDIRPTEDWKLLKKDVNQLNNLYQDSGVWRHVKKDGTVIYASISSHRIIFNNRSCMMVVARDTTEKLIFEKQLEKINKTLLEQRSKLSETQKIAKLGGWEYDVMNKHLSWAKELYFITGLKPQTGRRLLDVYLDYIHSEDIEMVKHESWTTIQTGKPLDIIYRLKAPTGDTKYVRQLGQVEYEGETPVKVVGSLQDVTEIKVLEEEKNKYLFNLEDTANSINEIFFTLNHNMEFTLVNKKFEQEYGLNAGEVKGRKLLDVFPAGIVNLNFYTAYEQVVHEHVVVNIEDYSPRLGQWLSMSGYPTKEGGAFYLTNITEQKQKDQQLQEAVERFNFVTKATKLAIYDYLIPEKHLRFEAGACDWMNDSPAPGTNGAEWWTQHIHPDDAAEVISQQKQAIAQKSTAWNMEYRLYCGTDTYHYVLDQGYFIFNENNDPVRLVGAIRDIDELKRSNEENKRLAGIITRINNMVIVMDAQNRVTWVNKAFEDFTGFKLQEVKGQIYGTFMRGPETSTEVTSYIQEQKSQLNAFNVTLVKYNKAGERYWAQVEFTPTFDDNRQHTGYIAVYQDITQRKAHEETLQRQNDALRSVAWLSSHEIRRPAASILGLIDLLEHSSEPTEQQHLIGLVSQCAHELDSIVHDITHKVEAELQIK
ncbi:PAS domain S-box protein [Mucilaginibacter sp. Bleaf8]|uniref:PAS domain S-box protein n=1 Tax=Mucilaginibacter sp. Bleaf8 TaxID=2834430 RepID=UPI001BCF7A37|nr:PAS domain S-box protein [Mucilaginibacter sp. Bleaf8]MBS7564481.1 PAS domain S-box protein [Mucilaginibacter sp. Bleaf8]